jgi:lipid-binding SYLF domain-containing protein
MFAGGYEMKVKTVSMLTLAIAITMGVIFSVAPVRAAKQEPTKAQKQAEIRKTANETLDSLYKLQPGSKEAIQKAAGYAVFSNFGMKIFFAGGGSGKGMAVNNGTKKETFMKMVEVQAGLGVGVKRFRLVWIFKTEQALNGFITSGWELGSQATASAQYDAKGAGLAGAVAISKDVWLYQLTDDGLALELTAKGTKYYKDDDLN